MGASDRKQRAERAEQMRKEREKADRRQRNLISVGIVVVVIALIAAGGYAVKSAQNDNTDSGTLVYPAHTDKKTFGFDYTAADAGGKVGTDPVVVTITEDFQCPICKSFEQQSGAFLYDLVKKGEITIDYRPISFLDDKSANEFSSRAANAAMCVLDKGGAGEYKKFHDLVYATQPEEDTAGPADAELIADAKQVGVTGIDRCIRKKVYGPWIEKAYDAAVADGFRGTPWVRVGGKEVESPTPDAMQKAIDAAKKS
jgi:protein-disulfide isomerase